MTDAAFSRPRLLAVDDDADNLLVLGRLLSQDYDLVVARSGEEALARAAADPRPGLILMDVVMPGKDGYEILAELKADPLTADIPVVFLTARVSEEDEARGFHAGAADYIIKPIRPSIVKARIKNLLDLKAKTDLLRELSRHDPLTGLLNKRSFGEILEKDWSYALRQESWISAALFDIDFFKAYNDGFGHVAGDECLASVARALASPLKRTVDVAARFGGEEFLLLMPGADPAGAIRVVEAARAAVASLGIAAANTSVSRIVTVSAGLASTRPCRGGTAASGGAPSSIVLVEAADSALYDAKRRGRDRACAVTI